MKWTNGTLAKGKQRLFSPTSLQGPVLIIIPRSICCTRQEDCDLSRQTAGLQRDEEQWTCGLSVYIIKVLMMTCQGQALQM